ncbi:MAG: DUF6324 family protein [Pseudomonadota bacterium]
MAKDDDGGTVRIGPTDQGMVRLIIGVSSGTFELDYSPDDAEEIAAEMKAAADIARRPQGNKPTKDRARRE